MKKVKQVAEDEVAKKEKEGYVKGELTPEEKEAGGEQITVKDKDGLYNGHRRVHSRTLSPAFSREHRLAHHWY